MYTAIVTHGRKRGAKRLWMTLSSFTLLLPLHPIGAEAQQVVEWEPIQELRPLRMLDPGKKIEVLGYRFGLPFQAVLSRLKTENPSAPIRSTQVFGDKSYIIVSKKSLSIGQGFKDLTYNGAIELRSETPSSVEEISFGFTTPATGNILIGLFRRTTLKNIADFVSEEQVYGPYASELGPPSHRTDFYAGHTASVWFILPNGSRAVPESCASKIVNCGETICPNEPYDLAAGGYQAVARTHQTKSFWGSQCSPYGLFVQVKLRGQPGRFNEIAVHVADFVAAREAYAADMEFVRKTQARFVPGSGSGYKQ